MRARLILVLVLAAGLVALLFWSRSHDEPPVVSGYLEAHEIRVGSRVGGRVAELFVEEGDVVSAGQRLVRFEPYDLRELRAEAAARVDEAASRLALLEAGYRVEEVEQAKALRDQRAAQLDEMRNGPRAQEIEAARAAVAHADAEIALAEVTQERARLLQAEDFTSEQTLDSATARLAIARADRAARAAELDELEEGTRSEWIARAEAEFAESDAAHRLKLAGFRPEEVASARAELAAQQAALATLDRRLAELEVRSPVDGVVQAVRLRPGDLVAPGAPAMTVLDRSSLWVRAYVPQRMLAVRLDQVVDVRVDAYPERTFEGRVGFVATRAEFTPRNVQTPEERAKQVFRIKVFLEEGHDDLLPGMTADVRLTKALP